MILDPDFLDHWRTRMVVDALDEDELAPLCILRLWAHCQTRKSDRFEMPTAGLKAQCRYKGDAQRFETALSDAGFIERNGKEVHVLGWAEKNSKLVSSWGREDRQLDVSSSEWLRLRAAVFERDGFRCVYCGDSEKNLDCDHVQPLSRGGKSVIENLVAACFSCNRSKGAKTLDEWRLH